MWGSTLSSTRVLVMISLVSFTGTLVYRLEISNEARLGFGHLADNLSP